MSLLREGISTVMYKTAVALMTLAADILIVRYFGAEGKGVFSVLVSFAAMAAAFSTFGMEYGTLYCHNREGAGLQVLIANSLVFLLAVNAAYLAAFFPFVAKTAVFKGIPVNYVYISSAFFTMELLFPVLLTLYLTEDRVGAYNRYSLLQKTLMALSLVAAGAITGNVTGVLFAYLSAMAATNLSMLAGYLRRGGLRTDWAAFVRAFSFGMKSFWSKIFSKLHYRVDVLIVNYFLGAAAVGYYGVAASISETVWLLSMSMAAVLYAKGRADDKELARMAAATSRNTFLLCALLGVFLAFAAPPLVRVIYGPDFALSARPLLLLLPGAVMYSFTSVLNPYFLAAGRPLAISAISLVSLCVNVASNLFLVPSLGISGAALSSSISYSVSSVVGLALFRRYSGLKLSEFTIADPAEIKALVMSRISRARVRA